MRSHNPRGSFKKHNQQKVRTFSFRKHLKFLKSTAWWRRTVDVKITAWIRSGCLKIHVDPLKMKKSKSTNFQLSRTPKITGNEPMSTENGPPEGIPDRISDPNLFLIKKRLVGELLYTPLNRRKKVRPGQNASRCPGRAGAERKCVQTDIRLTVTVSKPICI